MNEPYYCPKCKQFGIAWDARAKVLMCYYESCSHVIRNVKRVKEIPTENEIREAIEMSKSPIQPYGGQYSFPLANCNIAYTTASGQDIKLSLEALIKIVELLPKIPQIYTMPVNLINSPYVNGSTIIIGQDIADAIEEAIGK